MDHQAFAQLLGNYGEFVGAIAVVVTLVYLAIQIRQNSFATKTAAAQSVLVLLNEMSNLGAASPENARIVIRGQTEFEILNDDQKLQFALWMINFFRALDLAFQHYSNGLIAQSVWAGYASQLQSLMSSASVRRVWNARRELFSEEFRIYVEAIEPGDDVSDVRRALKLLLENDE